MHTDEDDQITLSKWPFYLGDLLLVATALSIAILRDWDLSSGQIAACVSAVALGAALFVLPFIVEFQFRVREAREDRSSELRALQRQLKEHESVLVAADARIVDLDRQLAAAAEATDAVAAAIEQKVEQIEAFKEGQAAEIANLKQAIEAQAAKSEQITTDPEVTQSIEAIAGKIAELSKEDVLSELSTRVEALENAPTPEPIVKEVIVAQPEVAEESTDEAPEKKARSPRKRRKPEPRLLNRAISES
ncbi:MAG: hypothetical protein ABF322_07595, partial [Lentimonas sp.]